jgi:hypothetical protein
MTPRPPADLAALDDAFAQAVVPTATPLPDGAYTVEVAAVELRRTRSAARPMLCWSLRVLCPPPAAGRRLCRYQVIGPRNLGWLKHDLALCGLDLPKLSTLPDHLDRLRGVRLDITKRTHGDFVAVSFRRRIE